MSTEFIIDGSQLFLATIGGVGTVCLAIMAWLAIRNVRRLDTDMAQKADKDPMERQLADLKAELHETREARERDNEAARKARELDNERIMRASAEKFAEFASSMKDRIGLMERHVDGRLTSMGKEFGDKLDLVLQVMDRRGLGG